MTINPIKIVFALSLWFITTSLVVGIYAWNWLNTERDFFKKENIFVVSKGASLHSVAKDLEEQSVIRWPKLWVYYAQFTQQTNIKAGEYEFDSQVSPIKIIAVLNSGKVVQHRVSLIEGTRFVDFVAAIQKHEKILKTFDIENQKKVLEAAGFDFSDPEGWFYPDTYQFSSGDTDLSLLKRAHNKLRMVLQEEWEQKVPGLPYKNSYEALIMASIVEKETGVAHERDQIAGVFVRRLNLGMKLQTDPTVIYGLGEKYTGNITRKDLKTPTSYNTYVIRGMPPTPIAMVSREAIYAALHPKEGNSLYFVAKGDGTHYFSETLEQHNRAVNKFQKNRRKDYRSVPAQLIEEKSEG